MNNYKIEVTEEGEDHNPIWYLNAKNEHLARRVAQRVAGALGCSIISVQFVGPSTYNSGWDMEIKRWCNLIESRTKFTQEWAGYLRTP